MVTFSIMTELINILTYIYIDLTEISAGAGLSLGIPGIMTYIGELLTAITTIVVAIIVNNTRKTRKDVKEIRMENNNFSGQLQDLSKRLDHTIEAVKPNMQINDFSLKVAKIMSNAMPYLSESKKLIIFVEAMGSVTTLFVSDIIATGITKLTRGEIRAKFNYLRKEIIAAYEHFENDSFVKVLRPELVAMGQEYLDAICDIVEDDFFNSKDDRIMLESLAFLNRCIVASVKKFHHYKS